MSKYRLLTDHLNSLEQDEWRISFAEIEAILGISLPDSARKYPAWWSNGADGGHSQSAAWQDVGWKTENLDLENEKITFAKRHRSLKAKGIAMRINESKNVTLSVNRKALSISEAKAGLAANFGVPIDSIEILIKG
jgi:hypothetical protein